MKERKNDCRPNDVEKEFDDNNLDNVWSDEDSSDNDCTNLDEIDFLLKQVQSSMKKSRQKKGNLEIFKVTPKCPNRKGKYKKKKIMKGLFWNIRGMGGVEKIGHLQDLIREHKFDFLGILETIKHDFSAEMLQKLSVGRGMVWKWMPATGRSGGILVGIDSEKLNIIGEVIGRYFIRLKLSNVDNKKVWDLMIVYGAAQVEQKADFLTELAKEVYSQSHPLMVGGDFNILRKESEKNKSGGYTKWSFIFNAIIEQANLREIQMGGRQFTWCNNQESPTLEKLDRVFINIDWEVAHPLTSVRPLVRAMSDHNPMLMETGQFLQPHKLFRFEQSWFLREDLVSIVSEVWNSSYNGSNLERWQKRMKHMRKKLKGWNKNWEGEYNRRKKFILDKIDAIDIQAET